MPILDHFGVDLMLAGHSHTYERSFLIDGFYGLTTEWSAARQRSLLDPGNGNDEPLCGHGAYRKGPGGRGGLVYAVMGCSGKQGVGLLDHPAMAVAKTTLGSMVLEIDGPRLIGQFLDYQGAVVDQFVIDKSGRPTLRRDLPSLSRAAGGRQVLQLEAGAGNAHRLYVLMGSFGSSPGTPIGALHLPLNFDTWMQLSLAAANTSLYPSSIGFLDATGRAAAGIQLAPNQDPTLFDLTLHHAFLVFDASLTPKLASNAVRLKLLR
jgi:hypothetical protein